MDIERRSEVSVVVTCFNEEENIGDCLESLLRQTYQPDLFEIIVSDGGSRDGTQEVIRSFQQRDNRVKLVVELKRGTAAGRNAGINAARHGLVALIDADCEAPVDWLEKLAAAWSRAD